MKKGELKVIAVILLILVLLLIWAVIWKTGEKSKKNNEQNQINTQQTPNNQTNEQYVETETDGTKVNISNQLKKEKQIDGLTVKNIKLQTQSNETIFTATVENKTNQTKGDYGILVIAKDETGKEIKTIAGYMNLVEPNQTTTLRIKTSFDFANTYDIELKKQ